MSVGRQLLRIWYRTAGLLIGCTRVLVFSAMIVTVLLVIFVLSAQLYRWWKAGEWHPVPVTELLQILGLGIVPDDLKDFRHIIEMLLALPATLTLFLVIVVLVCIKRLLDKVENHQRQKLLRSRQEDVIGAIDKALADSDR
jgi:hypothetical protein